MSEDSYNPIQVVSKYSKYLPIGTVVNVMRPSVLGNPYRVGEYSREEAVRLYNSWLRAKIAKKDPRVCSELNRLFNLAIGDGLTLECCCAPRKCHADVIKTVLDAAIAQR